MALAFPGQTGFMAEITAIDALVDSFTDHDLQKQVLQKSPATLAEALTWAVSIEAIDDRGTPETSPSFDRDGCHNNRRPHRDFMHLATSDGSFTPRAVSPGHAPHQAPHHQPSMHHPLQSGRPANWTPRPSAAQKDVSRASTIAYPSHSLITCYNCHGSGHICRDCPSPHTRAGLLMSTGTAWPSPSLPAAPPVPPLSPPCETGHANIVSWKRSTPKTFIKIKIAGFKQTCLLDTGWDYSLIPRRLVPTACLSPVNLDIYTANGSPKYILGCMTVRFHI